MKITILVQKVTPVLIKPWRNNHYSHIGVTLMAKSSCYLHGFYFTNAKK